MTDCIYLDFVKAFDSVSYVKLSKKLLDIGIQGNLPNWIKDFLTNRKQRVMDKCDWTKVASGIHSQGSIFGLILFTTFINDLPMSLTL